MGKVIVILLIAAAAWVGSVFHTEGTDKAFGGIFAPIESVRESESSAVLALSPAAQAADVPAQPRMNAGGVTQGVRNRLNESSERRR
ncbi:MAG: hypothetical protein JRG92_20270 [Deltaproteobacteria bacterium]|nr:hypothetical protein [Deltaproteobacteria bacterium]MBW2385975.1 hypothetical protein [Deltaproteobacteria bacterium]MBW2697651.1 hypothetical protein [Deltaproteobacteria bacterium]